MEVVEMEEDTAMWNHSAKEARDQFRHQWIIPITFHWNHLHSNFNEMFHGIL